MKDKILSRLPFYHWHPEVAMRYLPIVKFLKKREITNILEVGSGSLGIAPYIGIPVTGVDTDFTGPHHPRIKYVSGSVTNLPFPDKSWEAVLSVDMLEHLPEQLREKAVKEMLRVTNKYLIIAFPSGEASIKSDETLLKEYKYKFGKDFPFLKEHQTYHLPDVRDIEAIIPTKNTIHLEGNENLQVRSFLMQGWMTKNILIDILFRKILLAILPFVFVWNRPPYYRRIIYATIKL